MVIYDIDKYWNISHHVAVNDSDKVNWLEMKMPKDLSMNASFQIAENNTENVTLKFKNLTTGDKKTYEISL